MKLLRSLWLGWTLIILSQDVSGQINDQKEVLWLFHKKFEWLKNHQFDSLRWMLDDNLMYIHSNGWVETKADVIDDLKTGKLVYRKVDIMEASVRLYENTAIVTGKGAFAGVNSGAEFSLNLLFTEVYIKKGGRWLLASRHANRLP
ncbi:MAG: nuclear transport factor 2 family protein [Cyclobacteriaceae bacterium]|nr:nuclear transport factor 2 family protein [Cyclobacteriaceae bacterium]QOI97398.1 MAG: nuclear transport factor 2 family protein [Flammeovirgaceae bacterium]